jgi:hypothetical protein
VRVLEKLAYVKTCEKWAVFAEQSGGPPVHRIERWGRAAVGGISP